MSTTTKPKIKDLFNAFTNPSGSFTTAMSTAMMNNPKPQNQSVQALQQMYSAKPAPYAQPKPIVMPPMPAPGPMSMIPRPGTSAPAPSGRGGSSLSQAGGFTAPAAAAPAPAPAPVAPVAEAPATVPPQYMNPDGTMKTPEQVAADIALTLKNQSGRPDVPTMAGNQFGGGEKTAEQLQAEAMQLNNVRNDIAVGENDPYKVAANSGVAYSPAELKAIEQAYAGVYDPSLTTAFAKLDTKEKDDARKAKVADDAKAAEVAFSNDLKMLAEKHKYDLEAMKLDQDFEKSMIGYKAALDAQAMAGAGAGEMTAYSDERSQRTVQSIDELMGQVNGWTTGLKGTLMKNVPGTDAKTFDAQLNTLKAAIAFGELTAMREASKTGGALGNVSNVELTLLESALAGLDSAQAPEDFKTQLNKAKGSINRWRAAQGAAPLGTTQAPGAVVVAPDGTQVIITD